MFLNFGSKMSRQASVGPVLLLSSDICNTIYFYGLFKKLFSHDFPYPLQIPFYAFPCFMSLL